MLNRKSYSKSLSTRSNSLRSEVSNINNLSHISHISHKNQESQVNNKLDVEEKVKEKEKVKEQPQINVINVNDVNPESVLVYHDQTKYKFTFFDINKNLIGDFNILQVFKYINIDIDTYLTEIELSVSKDIIEKYLCIYDENRNINLISHIDSPFTGNVDLLTKMFVDIYKVTDYLDTELTKFTYSEIEKIKHNNNVFIYNLLIRILRLISSLSETDKANQIMFAKYSSGAAYKLCQLIKDELNIKNLKFDQIDADLTRLTQIKNTFSSKLEKLEANIVEQNNKIDVLINVLKQNKLYPSNVGLNGGLNGGLNNDNNSQSSLKLSDILSGTKSSDKLIEYLDSHDNNNNSSNNNTSNNSSYSSKSINTTTLENSSNTEMSKKTIKSYGGSSINNSSINNSSLSNFSNKSDESDHDIIINKIASNTNKVDISQLSPTSQTSQTSTLTK